MPFTFKSLTDENKAQLVEWLRNDPEHQRADPDLFTVPQPGRSQFAVCGEDGKPVLYATVEMIARVHIQFNPGGNKLRTAKALIAGLKQLERDLRERGFFEILFDSRYPSLIKFCRSALGFGPTQEYSLRLK